MEFLEPGFLQAKLREYEVRLIREALQRARGNQALAARILELPPTTLASQIDVGVGASLREGEGVDMDGNVGGGKGETESEFRF